MVKSNFFVDYDKNGKLISDATLFRKYSGGENAMTQGLLQLIHIGKESLYNFIFQDILPPVSDISQLRCQRYHADEPNSGKEGQRTLVDDGLVLAAPYNLLIESKIGRGCIDKFQFEKQLEFVNETNDAKEMRLLYITPDIIRPTLLKPIEKVSWINWQKIIERLKSYEPKNETVKYLVNSFIFMTDETLNYNPLECEKDDLVVVLAAGVTHKDILSTNCYQCKKDRYLYDTSLIAFYYDQKISSLFRVLDGPIDILDDLHDVRYELEFVRELDIVNDLTTESKIKKDGNQKKKPFTRGQPRYVTKQMLEQAKTTSQLEKMIEEFKNKRNNTNK